MVSRAFLSTESAAQLGKLTKLTQVWLSVETFYLFVVLPCSTGLRGGITKNMKQKKNKATQFNMKYQMR